MQHGVDRMNDNQQVSKSMAHDANEVQNLRMWHSMT